jgi:hypothetical protein
MKNAKTCFDAAKRAVYSLLESGYMRFQNTDTFQDMVRECGKYIILILISFFLLN